MLFATTSNCNALSQYTDLNMMLHINTRSSHRSAIWLISQWILFDTVKIEFQKHINRYLWADAFSTTSINKALSWSMVADFASVSWPGLQNLLHRQLIRYGHQKRINSVLPINSLKWEYGSQWIPYQHLMVVNATFESNRCSIHRFMILTITVITD